LKYRLYSLFFNTLILVYTNFGTHPSTTIKAFFTVLVADRAGMSSDL